MGSLVIVRMEMEMTIQWGKMMMMILTPPVQILPSDLRQDGGVKIVLELVIGLEDRTLKKNAKLRGCLNYVLKRVMHAQIVMIHLYNLRLNGKGKRRKSVAIGWIEEIRIESAILMVYVRHVALLVENAIKG